MKILLLSATEFEIIPLLTFLRNETVVGKSGFEISKNINLEPLIAGVGIPVITYNLTKFLRENRFDLVINAGIAGAISKKLKIGEVVEVISDRYADLGVEERTGDFTSVYELGLTDDLEYGDKNGIIENHDTTDFNFLKKVRGITVNKVHGSEDSIAKIIAKYPHAEIESMEGAAAAMVCKLEKVNFIQIRSISNYVEPRNRENWKIEEAIDNLNNVLIEILKEIGSQE